MQLLTSVQTFSRFSAEPNNLLIWIRSSWGTPLLKISDAVGKSPVRCSPWSHLKDKHLGAVSFTRSMELCGASVVPSQAQNGQVYVSMYSCAIFALWAVMVPL